MNTTMADGASERLDAQIADALFGQPGMSKLDVANRLRQLRGDGEPLLCGSCYGLGVIGYTSGQTPEQFEQGEYPCPDCADRQPVGEAWIVVKEHAWDHGDGGRPTLAYLWPYEFERRVYPSFAAASEFIKAGDWPLGFVAMQIQAPLPQAVDLGDFKALYQAYVRLLEAGRDRINDLGGSCDPVDVMKANDLDLQAARRVIESKAVTSG